MAENLNAGMPNNGRGFSLTELLVALAISGFLLNVASTYYMEYQNEGRFFQVKSALVSFQLAEQNYYLLHGQYSHTTTPFIDSTLADIAVQTSDNKTYLYTVNLKFFPTGYACKVVWITPHARGPSECW